VGGLGITELSSALKLPKSTVHRLIVTLEAAGYVAFDPATATYSLGGRAARLAEQLNHQSPLLAFAGPMLELLTRECDNEEYTRGLRCIAAPIKDVSSNVIAAMSLSMFKHKMTAARRAFFKAALLRATSEVSEKLGYLPAAGNGE